MNVLFIQEVRDHLSCFNTRKYVSTFVAEELELTFSIGFEEENPYFHTARI